MKRKLSRKEWALFLSPILFLLFFMFIRLKWNVNYSPRDKQRMLSCQSNLRQVWLGIQAYAKDNDSQFPPVVVGGTTVRGWKGITTPNGKALPSAYKGRPVGWIDATIPYFYSESLLMCPSESQGDQLAASNSRYTDYWMNSNLSNVMEKMVVSPSVTLLLGEGNDGIDKSDATYNKNALPPQWLTNRDSPAYRHIGGANYLMADGTVHWLKPDEVTTFGGRKNAFALK